MGEYRVTSTFFNENVNDFVVPACYFVDESWQKLGVAWVMA